MLFMNRLRQMMALGVLACAVSCAPRNDVANGSAPQQSGDERIWQRAVDCAHRGDVLSAEQRREDRPEGFMLTSTRTHYSAKTGRCYVLMHFTNGMRGAIATGRTEVVDGLERYQYAQFVEPISEPSFQAAECRQMTTDGKRELSAPGCQRVAEYVDTLMRE